MATDKTDALTGLRRDVDQLQCKVDVLSEAIVRAFAAAGVPGPQPPRPDLRVIDGRRPG
jgi:hypothetical protein